MTEPAPARVSVVVPAYNHGSYVARALDSLLAQDYPRLEVIVLDDGSTDETPAVLARYTGRVRWERQENMGQAATLNKGWAMASGELLGYLSADDVLRPGAIRAVATVLARDSGLVLAYPDYDLIDARGERLRTVRTPEFDYQAVVSTWVCPPGPGALFRRAPAEAVGYWDTTLRLSPDYAFWLRLGLLGRAERVPEVLAGFRVHEGSQTFSAVPPERSDEYLRVSREFFASPSLPASVRSLERKALSNAYLFAARSHLRSARYSTGVRRAAEGLRLYPRNIRPSAAKVLAHGLLSHVRYGRRASLGAP